MIKNTEREYQIIKRNITKKIKIGTGIFITSLLAATTSISGRELTKQNNEIIEEYLNQLDNEKQQPSYNETIENITKLIDSKQLDENFINIYNTVKSITIDEKKYDIDIVYARHIVGGGTKFIDRSTPYINYDIIEEKTFDDICDQLIPIKNTSVFYQLYLDGKISNEDMIITKKELKDYTKEWDGQIHEECPITIATKKADNYYLKRMEKAR